MSNKSPKVEPFHQSAGRTAPLFSNGHWIPPSLCGRAVLCTIGERHDLADETNTEQTRIPLAGTQDADKTPILQGRKAIYTDYESVNAFNVIDALNNALIVHGVNAGAISYLWNYYRGRQPVLDRSKEVRPEINNKVVENHAQEIVAFKIGYQLAEPLQYTCRTYDEEDGAEAGAENKRLSSVNELNTLMFAEDKASCDRDLFEWMCIAGVGYRMCEADTAADEEDGGAPFEIYTLDPRCTFVVYSSAYHHRPVMAVWIGKSADRTETIYNVFTDTTFFRIKDQSIIDAKPHTYGAIPIVEYRLNNARMGVFEPVLSLLDAINDVESNRLDSIEQNVQALMKFIDCDVTAADFTEMLKLGAVKVTSIDSQRGDIDIIKNDLDQTSTQTTKDDLYQSAVNICGMPNRNGTSGSSSDTGAAVLLRDGWTLAESHAKSYELQFKRSEREFLRVVLAICSQSKMTDLDLRIRDIELAFNRRNYENILVKAQVLTTMLASDEIHPQLAFQACGLFTDPEAAYMLSCKYVEEKGGQLADVALLAAQRLAEQDGMQGTGQDELNVGSQAGVPEPQGDNAAKTANA